MHFNQENINKYWSSLLENNSTPKFFRSLKSLDFKILTDLIDDEREEELKEIINNMFKGDIYQFTGAIKDELIQDLFSEAANLAKNSISRQTLCEQGVKNFFYLQKDDQTIKGGYKSIDRSYYFFPWNKTQKKIFEKINPIWSYIKILGGQNKNQFNENLPLDGIINRVHVIQYIKGGGTISPHNDPYDYQKIQIGCVLNNYGSDYSSGGFSVFNKEKEKVLLEPEIKKGSLVCFFPSLIHTVEPVDLHEDIDYETNKGRWYLSLTSVGSAHLKNRKKAMAENV